MVHSRNKAHWVLSSFPQVQREQGLLKELSLEYFNMRNSLFSPCLIVRNLYLKLKSSMNIVSLNH